MAMPYGSSGMDAQPFDVAVIGAGISGLTAAALLTRAGLKVCVIEEQPHPGGYLQGFERRGYVFDTAIQWLNGLGETGIMTRVFGHIGDDYPRCRPLTRTRRYRGSGFDYLLTRDPEELLATLCRDFPHEAAGLRRFFDDCRELGRRYRVLYGRMRALETFSFWEKTLYGLRMLVWYLGVRRLLRAGIAEGLARYVKDPAIARIFCAEEKLATAMTPIAWSYEGDLFASPPGGSQAWVRWLAHRLTEAGGALLLGEPVERVLLDAKGRAAGVRTAAGREVPARFVVGACDVERLYESLLPEGTVPEALRRKLHDADLYYSNVTLFLGIDCDPRSLGLDEELVLLTREDLPREQQENGEAETTALTIVAPSVRDPSMAPSGHGTVTIQCPAWLRHHDRWMTGPGLERGLAYRRFKQAFAQVMLDRVEAGLCPGLSAHIRLMEVATPVTYFRYTGNRDGSIMGQTASDRNIKARLAHYRTPVQNLLLCGHWSEYGGGVPIAVRAAVNASLLILKKTNPRAFRDLCHVMD